MVEQVTVAVDANGADLGPAEVARGAALAAARGIDVILFGPAGELAGAGVEVVDAPVSIAKAADPARAVRSTPEASIVQAVEPVPGSPFLLLDAGANVAVRPEHLVQFAHMGAAFMEVVMGVQRPRVALLSNGEEPSKGPEDVVAAHAALSESPGAIDFVGNVEGFAIGKGVCDVLVADGFAGNVALKVMEGTSDVLLRSVRDAAMSSLRSKLGGLLLKPALGGLRAQIDPEAHGGAVLLGLRHLSVVPHGSFGARGFASAIEVAARGVREDVLGRTHERLAEAGALRSVPEPSAAAATLPDQP